MRMNQRRLAATSAFAGAAYAAPKDDPQSPAEIAAAIQKTFEDFKAANDERLAQLEKRGEDAVTRDQVEKINGEITRLGDVLDQKSKELARLKVGGGANDNDETKAAARFLTTARGKRIKPDSAECDVAAYRAYKDGFEELVRANGNINAVSREIQASLSIGSDRDGGYLVPAEMGTEIERRVFDSSPMRQVARVLTIGKGAWEGPYKSSKGVSGGWVGERQPRPATGTGTYGMQRIEAHEQYAYPEITTNMLDDADFDVQGNLVEDTEEEMIRTENTGFVTGDGVMKPRGVLDYKATAVATADATRDWGKLQYIPTGAAAGFQTLSTGSPVASPADVFIDTIAELNPAYRTNANWMMARRTEAEIRKFKDGDGRYMVGFGDIRDNAFGFSLMGFPIVNMEDFPAVEAGATPVAFGDFRRGYWIVDRIGFRLLVDPYTNKPYVGFYITKRVGGDVRNFDAIKLIKVGTS